MTERSQCGYANDGLAMDASSGMTPPLLPTLVMALVLGAASFLCREPAVPAPAPTALAARIVSAPATLMAEASPTPPFVPAALAFPRQFPFVAAAAPMPVVAQHRPAGPRVAALRRAAPARTPVGDVAEVPRVEAPRADVPHVAPVASVAQGEAPMPAAADDLLPDLVLPFAPAIRAVGRARDFVGAQGAAARTQASALGGAVADFVGTLR